MLSRSRRTVTLCAAAAEGSATDGAATATAAASRTVERRWRMPELPVCDVVLDHTEASWVYSAGQNHDPDPRLDVTGMSRAAVPAGKRRRLAADGHPAGRRSAAACRGAVQSRA